MSLVYRDTKLAELEHAEVDENFRHLDQKSDLYVVGDIYRGPVQRIYNGQLYLLSDAVTFPFTATNFTLELANGDWILATQSTTDDLSEGSANLYFQESRVLSTILAGISGAGGIFTSANSILEAFANIKNFIDNVALYIPLSGTTTGNPVTGDIEFNTSNRQIKSSTGAYVEFVDDGTMNINKDSGSNVNITGIEFNGFSDSEFGIRGTKDYSPNITALDYTQKKYVDNVLSTKSELNPRVQTVTSSATVTPTSLNDIVTITSQAVGLTLANPTGIFVEGQALMIRIKDNGTARTIVFGSNYRAIGVILPTTTVINKTMYLGIIYNSIDDKWDILGLNQEI